MEERNQEHTPFFKRWGLWCVLTILLLGGMLYGYYGIYTPGLEMAYEKGYMAGMGAQATVTQEVREQLEQAKLENAELAEQYRRRGYKIDAIYRGLKDAAKEMYTTNSLLRQYPNLPIEKPTIDAFMEAIDKTLGTQLLDEYMKEDSNLQKLSNDFAAQTYRAIQATEKNPPN